MSETPGIKAIAPPEGAVARPFASGEEPECLITTNDEYTDASLRPPDERGSIVERRERLDRIRLDIQRLGAQVDKAETSHYDPKLLAKLTAQKIEGILDGGWRDGADAHWDADDAFHEGESLSQKQRRFVEEYLLDGNAEKAAVRAGYVPGTQGQANHGKPLVSHPGIYRAIVKAQAQRAARLQLKGDDIVQEIAILGFSDISHYFIDDTGHVQLAPGAPAGAMRAISSIKRKSTKTVNQKTGDVTFTYDVEIRLWDKPAPLRLLAKHVGLNLNERVEVTGKNGTPIAAVVRHIVDAAVVARQEENTIEGEVISDGVAGRQVAQDGNG